MRQEGFVFWDVLLGVTIAGLGIATIGFFMQSSINYFTHTATEEEALQYSCNVLEQSKASVMQGGAPVHPVQITEETIGGITMQVLSVPIENHSRRATEPLEVVVWPRQEMRAQPASAP